MSEDLQKRLSRWSERKLAARRGTPKDEDDEVRPGDVQNIEAELKPEAVETSEAADEPMPELPPIDELTAESDYTAFFGAKVPEALKNAALRKLWRSDPVFANRDGLCDYDEDFNALLTPITQAQTGYQAGKGYLDDIEDAVAKLESANDENKPVESPGEIAAAGGESGEMDAAAMGNSDAAGDDSAAAPRQELTAESDQAKSGPMMDKDN